jgi:hypothetical protein
VSGAPDRPLKGLLALVDRLRRASGKRAADIVLSWACALIAMVIALVLSATTPFRFVENLTYDLRRTWGPRPRRRTSSLSRSTTRRSTT